MVALRGGAIDSVTFEQACAARGTVDPAGELVRCARAIGIELGTEGLEPAPCA